MALITRDNTKADIEVSNSQFAPQIHGIAGENLDPAAPCYKKVSDNKIYMCNGTAADAAAKLWGWNARAKNAGEPVTLFIGAGLVMEYGSSLTVDQDLYIGATAGRLDTAASTGGTVVVARTLDDRRVLTLA